MRANAEDILTTDAPILPIATVVREGVRALVAFAFYLMLYPLWTASGAQDLYLAIVLKIGSVIVLATQHFPVYSKLENLSVSYLDFLIPFVLAYFVVSHRMKWMLRLRRFGSLFALLVIFHILAVIFEIRVDTARALSSSQGFELLLPWELGIVDTLRYLFVDLGLQVGPFLLMLLAATWNSNIDIPALLGRQVPAPHDAETRPRPAAPRGRPGVGRGLPVAAAVSVLVAGIAVSVWIPAREADPRHTRTHVQLGSRFLQDGQRGLAEEQYRVAIENGTTDGEAWYNLSGILSQRGQASESLRVLKEGVAVVNDLEWQNRMRHEVESWQDSR